MHLRQFRQVGIIHTNLSRSTLAYTIKYTISKLLVRGMWIGGQLLLLQGSQVYFGRLLCSGILQYCLPCKLPPASTRRVAPLNTQGSMVFSCETTSISLYFCLFVDNSQLFTPKLLFSYIYRNLQETRFVKFKQLSKTSLCRTCT